jgi:hypothetical protein
MDGNHEIVGGMHTGTMYPSYRDYFDQRKLVSSPFDIGLSVSYDTLARTGTLTIVARNTGASSITGQLQTAITESHVYQVWQNMDSVHHIERNMLPSAAGEAITVAAGDSVIRTRDFTIDAAWVARNCKLIVFIQNNSSKEIYQGAITDVVQRVTLAYAGFSGTFATPGSDVDLAPVVRNLGSLVGTGISGTLSTTDPYVTVTAATRSYPEIGIAQDVVPDAPFGLHVDPACPNDHVATLNLDLGCGDDVVANLTLPMMVTTGRGLSDDIEHGVGGWTQSGTNSQWTQTTTRSYSPTHSWGTTASGQYPNETDMRLLSPYFVPGDAAQLSYWQWYQVEQDYDYCLVELNTGGPFWVPIASFTGSAQNWTQQTFNLERYAGSTLRIRFRFISDSSVQGSGWFVDDVLVSPFVAGVADGAGAHSARVVLTANPVRSRAEISYQVPAGTTSSLVVCDVAGRTVATIGQGLVGVGRAEWNLSDAQSHRVSPGTYFVRLAGAGTQAKVVVAE